MSIKTIKVTMKMIWQESIPVGCILPAWKLYVLQFQWPPPDVVPGVGGGQDPQVIKVEQVFSDHHQMLLGEAGP